MELDLLIPSARSLKDKRRVIKSLKDRMRSRYNCAVAETDYQDHWARAQLTVCVVSNEGSHANAQLSEIARFTELNAAGELLDYRMEFL